MKEKVIIQIEDTSIKDAFNKPVKTKATYSKCDSLEKVEISINDNDLLVFTSKDQLLAFRNTIDSTLNKILSNWSTPTSRTPPSFQV